MIEGKVSPSSQFCPAAIQSPSLFFCFGLFWFVGIFWPCITLKWPCIIFWTVSIWGRSPSWQVQQRLQFNRCVSNSLKLGFEALRHQFQHYQDHSAAAYVQACVIYVCLQFYCWFMCCLPLNRGSDSTPVGAISWWYKPPKGTPQVGRLLVEEFAPTKPNRNPSVAEGNLLGMAAAPRGGFCRPEEFQDVLTQHVPRRLW